MRARTWIMALGGLSLVLAAGWYNSWMKGLTQVPKPSQATKYLPGAIKTRVEVRHANFVWSDLESTNYDIFINNLRALGCPEPTVRNIILAEINQLYMHRRNNEVLLPEQQWWSTSPDLEMARSAVEKIKGLEAERQALLTRLLGQGWEAASFAQLPPIYSPLLTKLLGPGWETADSVASPQSASGISLTGPLLGDLSDQSKQRVYEIAAGYRRKLQAYREAQKLEGQPVDPAEVARLQDEERNQLSGVLTSDQDQEFLLRYSQTAQQIRDQMAGVNLSPDQFRGLFEALDSMASQPAYYYNGNDPDLLKQKQALQAQSDAALKDALGDQAYAAYKLNQDPLYLSAKATAQQAGIPAETVLPLYQINRATQAELDRIRNDTSLSDDEKMEAIAATQVQQQQTVAKLVGPDGFQRWLQAQSQSQSQSQPQSPSQPLQPLPATPPAAGAAPPQ